MTANPLTAFSCDRCGRTENVALTNSPGHVRQAGPEKWLAIVVGTDPGTPPSHLCPPCAHGFKAFMDAKAGP
jgi:hypothetical protein